MGDPQIAQISYVLQVKTDMNGNGRLFSNPFTTRLQPQFLLKRLRAQVRYVKLCAKSHCIYTLVVHPLVVEQSMDLLPLVPDITGQSILKHMAKNCGTLN